MYNYCRLRHMSDGSPGEVTRLLILWSKGEQDALAKLIPYVHDELYRLARHYMRREQPGHSLQATALVNESYLKLVDSSRVHWQDRAHFIAVAAQVMRRILVDLARRRGARKHGGDCVRVAFDEDLSVADKQVPDFIALDEALQKLAKFDSRKAKVVELRFFGGLSVEESAEALHVSADTVGRDWIAAKAWLLRELKPRA